MACMRRIGHQIMMPQSLKTAYPPFRSKLWIATSGTDNAINTFVTLLSRPLIAECLAYDACFYDLFWDPDKLMARAYGELLGIVPVKERYVGDPTETRNSRRVSIIRTLKYNIPVANDMLSLIDEIIYQCRLASEVMIPLEETVSYVPGIARVSDQTARFYQLRGHMIPAEIFTNANSRTAWVELSTPSTHWVDLAGIEFDLSENYPKTWTKVQDGTALGYYEGKALQHNKKVRGMIAGALICYFASLVQKPDMEWLDGWVRRKKRQFQDLIPDVPLDRHITTSICSNFLEMYRHGNVQAEEVYRQLVASWSQLQIPKELSFTWFLEEFDRPYVHCLAIISNVVTRMRFFDVDMLIGEGVFEIHFQEVLTLARNLLRNPFCYIAIPIVVYIHGYAYLADLCTYIKSHLMKDSFIGGHRDIYATSKFELEIRARKVFEISQEYTNDLHNLYRNRCLQAGTNLVEAGGQFFEYAQGAEGAQVGNIQVEGIDDQRETDQERRQNLQQLRAAWPLQARQLPEDARLITREHMMEQLLNRMSDKSRAFTLVMRYIYTNTIQTPQVPTPNNATNLPPVERAIPATIQAALRHWDVEVPDAWLVAVDKHAPTDQGGHIGTTELYSVPRVSVNVPQVVADAPPNPPPNPPPGPED